MNNGLSLPVLLLTLMVAFLLHFQPLRGDWSFWRPLWVFMVVVFWVLREPHQLNIGFAWLAGLVLDVLTAGTLGQHAMAMGCCAYVLQQAGQRLHHFALWHQTVLVALLALFYQLIIVVFGLLAGKPADTWRMFYPVLPTVLLWPLVALLLSRLHRPVL